MVPEELWPMKDFCF